MVSSEPNLHVLFPQLSQMWQRLGKRERWLCTPWGGRNETEPLFCFPMEKTLPPSERHLLTWWGGTAGVVNQAATVQGPATSQHQGLTLTPHILSVLLCQFTPFTLSCLMKCCWICIFPLPHDLWNYESGKHNTDIKYIFKTVSQHITHTARIMTFPQINERNIYQIICVWLCTSNNSINIKESHQN